MKFISYNLKNAEIIIKQTVKVLREGGLVIFPSDTVYGLLVDAKNKEAVEKLTRFKNRPPGKPISVFVTDHEMLEDYVKTGEKQKELLKDLIPGPFTVILESKHTVDKLLESEKGTLGVRIPDYTLVRELVRAYGMPVTATSANMSGRSPHYSVESLFNDLPKEKQKLVDLVVDAGTLPRNKPSTIIDLSRPQVKILRRGDVVFNESKELVSESPHQTQKVGEYLIGKYDKDLKKPLVFIIQGDLGAGKTVLIKGVAKKLGIENIISPTYVIYYEYGNFYHFDLYQIEESQEFKHLRVEKLLKPGNILCFEWGEKIGELYEILKEKAKIVYVNIEYIGESERKITIKD